MTSDVSITDHVHWIMYANTVRISWSQDYSYAICMHGSTRESKKTRQVQGLNRNLYVELWRDWNTNTSSNLNSFRFFRSYIFRVSESRISLYLITSSKDEINFSYPSIEINFIFIIICNWICWFLCILYMYYTCMYIELSKWSEK